MKSFNAFLRERLAIGKPKFGMNHPDFDDGEWDPSYPGHYHTEIRVNDAVVELSVRHRGLEQEDVFNIGFGVAGDKTSINVAAMFSAISSVILEAIKASDGKIYYLKGDTKQKHRIYSTFAKDPSVIARLKSMGYVINPEWEDKYQEYKWGSPFGGSVIIAKIGADFSVDENGW